MRLLRRYAPRSPVRLRGGDHERGLLRHRNPNPRRTVTAEGHLDFRGTLGVDKTAPVGFQTIRLRFELDTDATEEQLATLYKLTERYCVVFQTLSKPPTMEFRRTL